MSSLLGATSAPANSFRAALPSLSVSNRFFSPGAFHLQLHSDTIWPPGFCLLLVSLSLSIVIADRPASPLYIPSPQDRISHSRSNGDGPPYASSSASHRVSVVLQPSAVCRSEYVPLVCEAMCHGRFAVPVLHVYILASRRTLIVVCRARSIGCMCELRGVRPIRCDPSQLDRV